MKKQTARDLASDIIGENNLHQLDDAGLIILYRDTRDIFKRTLVKTKRELKKMKENDKAPLLEKIMEALGVDSEKLIIPAIRQLQVQAEEEPDEQISSLSPAVVQPKEKSKKPEMTMSGGDWTPTRIIRQDVPNVRHKRKPGEI